MSGVAEAAQRALDGIARVRERAPGGDTGAVAPVAGARREGGVIDLGGSLSSMAEAMGYPENVVRAKARRLIRRGLITGCACGCRGDFLRATP